MFPLGGIPVNGTQMAMMMAFDSGTMLERVLEANGSNSEVES